MIFNIRAADSQKDSKTGICSVLVNETVSISNTANLLTALKIGVGTKVKLTDNLDISDRLVNGAMGNRLYMDNRRDNPLIGRIFVKFDDPKAGNSRKDGSLQVELKECVQSTAETKSFPYRLETKKEAVFFSHSIHNYYP